MRHKRWMLGVGALAIVASALMAADRQPAPPYEFELRRTANGVALECRHGCNWMSLTGGCEKGQDGCTFVVNQDGIRTLPPPTQPSSGSR